ncbi:NEL-type E3 ubiquitin ligase domain-containing protein [Pseudomonas sp. Irchel 3E13]|uniref:NEL-type E3 ubiquitin ligase domain-containing protein n=1 Tax=Pseudomonas sp. Irchel 3E13 TaxID=2008975 RepID=UPI000BA3E84A|nr:NEL-type E3 ubiquitin ligase domain-containing protein [Pseudomonas sp. Irchel 3E13]
MSPSSTRSPDSSADVALDDNSAIDRFIASQAPQWLKSASVDRLDQLQASLAAHQALQGRVARLLESIRPVEDFVIPLLQNALAQEGEVALDIREALWRDVRLRVTRPLFPITDVDLPTFKLYSRDSSLFHRVLQNFTGAQAKASNYYPGAGIVQAGKMLDLPPERLAEICRRLDLGSQYQQHLETLLQPADTQALQQVLHVLAEDMRCALAAHAHSASLRGQIDDQALQGLLKLATADAHANPGQLPVCCRFLEVLGFAVPGVLIFEARDKGLPGAVREQAGAAPRQLVFYWPNDPRQPLRQYSSWYALATDLGNDLKNSTYRDRFTHLLAQDDRLGFVIKLASRLEAPRPDLEVVGLTAQDVEFSRLVQHRISRLKADAAALVVPTSAADLEVYQQRIAALESAGVSVLMLTASFLPVVGELMLVNLVWEMLGEVYEGVQEWRRGQHEEALDHMLGVVRDLALTTIGSVAAITVVRTLQRSEFIGRLLPVLRADGTLRLWLADLSAYALPLLSLPFPHRLDADGLIRKQGRQWWRQGDRVFEVRQDPRSGRWLILHPTRAEGYTPILSGNGRGAWWLPGEHPLQWQGTANLLRRLLPGSEDVSDLACERAVAVAGGDEAMLRGLLVERRAVPATLRHTLAQFALDARIDRFFEQLQQGQPMSALDPELAGYTKALLNRPHALPVDERATWQSGSPSLRALLFDNTAARQSSKLDSRGALLRRDFPGLPAVHIRALIDEAGEAALRSIDERGRIPLAMAEQARLALSEVRVSQALQGLCLHNVCPDLSVRLAFGLLRHLPEWPEGFSFELRDGSVHGRVIERLLPLSDTRQVRILLRAGAQFDVFGELDPVGNQAEPGNLFHAILEGLGPVNAQALGLEGEQADEQLRQLLLDRAIADRQRVPVLIGMASRPGVFNPLRRTAEGRPGYPLSGRGATGRTSLTSMVRSLFPGFDDQEVSRFLEGISAAHDDPMSELLRYQRSLHHLEETLYRWQLQATTQQANGRRRVVEEIRRCWCRLTAPMHGTDGALLGYRLNLGYVATGDFPELSADIDFSHVVELTLPDAQQSQRISGFLQSFTRLRWLDMSGNALTDIPQAVGNMRELRHLVLESNLIRISTMGQQILSSLSRLEILSLDHNPLDVAPDVSRLPRLQRLGLRQTRLRSLPPGVLSLPFVEFADLRGNQLATLPDGFFESPQHVRSALLLQGNPLSPAVRARLWDMTEDVPISSELLRERWLDDAQGEVLVERGERWDRLHAEPNSGDFFALLGRLLTTAEFRLAGVDLRVRVWRMLNGCVESTELRETLFDLAAGPTTCADSVESNFSVLEVRFLLHQARRQANWGLSHSVLLRFCRRLFRLERLELHVRQVITERYAQGRGVDEVEVSLAYRTGLARELELPGQPSHMDFSQIAGVTPQDLREAVRVVRADEQGNELPRFIASRDYWVEYLREQHPAAFAELEDRFWHRLDELGAQHASLPEGEYLARMNSLAAERSAAFQDLALRLTGEAMRQDPPV